MFATFSAVDLAGCTPILPEHAIAKDLATDETRQAVEDYIFRSSMRSNVDRVQDKEFSTIKGASCFKTADSMPFQSPELIILPLASLRKRPRTGGSASLNPAGCGELSAYRNRRIASGRHR